MGEPRSVVVTGASRGLGFATAVRLYRDGWRVIAAMRTPEKAMPLLRGAISKQGLPAPDDERLIGVQLDLLDAGSIAAAAKAIEACRGGGLNVLGAVSLVDREEGAAEHVESVIKCPFDRIYRLSEL